MISRQSLKIAAALLATSATAQVTYTVRCLSESVWAGVPAVVEVAAWNTGSTPIEILDLDDPYISLIGWKWRGAGGAVYEVRLTDYHFTAVPEPEMPDRLTLEPDQRTSWRVTIPTPTEFETGNPWLLTAEIKNPDRPADLATTEVDPHAATTPNILGQLNASLLQAALLEDPRADVISSQLSADDWQAIKNAASESDPVARLVLFSRSLLTAQGVEAHWNQLANQPPPLTLLRDYLLLTSRTKLDPAIRRTLTAQIDANSPLRSRFAGDF